MEEEKIEVQRGRKKRRRRAVPSVASIDYPSTLPSRELEVPTITTQHTICDYLDEDRAIPRSKQFEDNLYVVPIPREKNFINVPGLIDDFLAQVVSQSEEISIPYTSTSIDIEPVGKFFVLKLRERYFPERPARVVLLPQDQAKRTFGVFTTEKALPSSS